MLIRIEGPYFVAGYDTETKKIAPIIRFMAGWSFYKMINFCAKRGWNISITEPRGLMGTPQPEPSETPFNELSENS